MRNRDSLYADGHTETGVSAFERLPSQPERNTPFSPSQVMLVKRMFEILPDGTPSLRSWVVRTIGSAVPHQQSAKRRVPMMILENETFFA